MDETQKEDFLERINKIVDNNRSIKKKKIAKSLGITPSYITQIFKGTKAGHGYIFPIAQYLAERSNSSVCEILGLHSTRILKIVKLAEEMSTNEQSMLIRDLSTGKISKIIPSKVSIHNSPK